MLNFDVAVLIFILVDWLIGITITPSQGLLSLVAWDSVGNSNWYIFSIIILYLCSFAAFKFFGCDKRGLACICLLIITYSLIMSFLKPSWWYDTTFAYAFGSVYGYYKDKIDAIFQRYYIQLLIFTLALFTAMYLFPDYRGFVTNFRSISLSVIVLLLTMKIPLKNNFLAWSGKQLFPIYIYQRLPMIILSIVPLGATPLIGHSIAFYVAICFICTIIIAYLHKYIAIKL